MNIQILLDTVMTWDDSDVDYTDAIRNQLYLMLDFNPDESGFFILD